MINTFYGYGYYFDKIPKDVDLDTLTDSCWFFPMKIGTEAFFFGVPIAPINEGESFLIPINPNFNHKDFMDMLAEYKELFHQRPSVAHNYIISQIL
jgi:hypothetical protein